jgi:hypothetical protein
MRVFKHIVDAVRATIGVVASEAWATTPGSKDCIHLVFWKMSIKFRYIDAPPIAPASSRSFPNIRSEILFLTDTMANSAHCPEG